MGRCEKDPEEAEMAPSYMKGKIWYEEDKRFHDHKTDNYRVQML